MAKNTKSKLKSKENITQQSTLRTAQMCARLLCTVRHRTVQIIFPLTFQTIITVWMLSTGGVFSIHMTCGHHQFITTSVFFPYLLQNRMFRDKQQMFLVDYDNGSAYPTDCVYVCVCVSQHIISALCTVVADVKFLQFHKVGDITRKT